MLTQCCKKFPLAKVSGSTYTVTSCKLSVGFINHILSGLPKVCDTFDTTQLHVTKENNFKLTP